MKRFLAFTFAVYLISLPVGLCYASFASPFVSRLAASAATAGASGGISIPAKVTGVTSGGLNVASWISLLIPGSNLAKIGIAVAGVGGALASDYLMAKGAAWLAARNLTHDADGWTERNTVAVPAGHAIGDYTNPMIYFDDMVHYSEFHGMYATASAAYAAANEYFATFPSRCIQSPVNAYTNTQPYHAGYYYFNVTNNPRPTNNDCTPSDLPAGQTYFSHVFWYPYFSGGTNETHYTPVADSYVQTLLSGDIVSGLNNAGIFAGAAVEVAAAALDNPNHPVNSNATSKAAIAAALAASISAGQLTNLEAAAVPNVGDNVLPDTEPNVNSLTPAQIAAAVQAALAGQGLSAAQIAAAIAAAQAAAAGGASAAEIQAAMTAALAGAGLSAAQIQAAVEAATAAAFPPVGAYTGEFAATAWAAPTVGDFAGLFSSFLNDMRNTPLFSLPGLLSASVPSGGNCEMSVNMSERFGGSKTISICNWETGLSGVKAALLCVASIFAIGIVTKGGG